MTLKSVLDIEINDKEFRDYLKLFDGYQEQLKKAGAAGKRVGQGLAGSGKSVDKITASLGVQSILLAKMLKTEKTQEEVVKHTASYWRDLAKSSGQFATRIGDATKHLLKLGALTGLVGGLIGGGGLFGFERLAAATAQGRRSSLGLGLSVGEQRAFATNYRRLVDPDAFLGGVNESLHDVEQRKRLLGLGLTNKELQGSTADVAQNALRHLKGLADQTPDALLGNALRSRGLEGLVGLEDFQRLKHTSQGELDQLAAGYRRDTSSFGIDPETQKKMQDFSTQLARAGTQIETILVNKLGDLAPALGKLSDSVVRSIGALSDNPHIGEYIADFGKAIEGAAEYLGGEKFQNDLHRVGDGIDWLAKKLGFTSGPATENYGPYVNGGPAKVSLFGHDFVDKDRAKLLSAAIAAAGGSSLINPGNIKDPRTGLLMNYPDTASAIRALDNQIKRDETVHGQDTLRKIFMGTKDWGPYSTTDQEAYLKNVSNWTGIGYDDKLNPNDPRQRSSIESAVTRQEGRQKFDQKVIVEIINNTGGNAIVTASQVAQ